MRDLTAVKNALRQHQIELPSWAFGNSGTRFKVFGQPGVPRTPYEKADDAAHPGNADPGGKVFRPVGHQQADHVAPPEALRLRPAGIAVRMLRQGAEAEVFAVRQQGRGVAESFREFLDDDRKDARGGAGDR